MSTTNSPNPLRQQTLPTEPEPSGQWYMPILPFAKVVGWTILIYLIGPFTIFYAIAMQEDAAGPAWQADKRWANANGAAFFWPLWYIPIAIFHAPLAAFWSALLLTIAQWIHLPGLALLGGTTIFPPVLSSTLLRWILSLPLSGFITIIREAIHPETTWEAKRVLTPDEQMEMAAAVAVREKQKIAAAATSRTSTPSSTTPAKKKPRTPAKPKPVQHHPVTPKADSLWGSIDWNTVPNTHPAKQAALQAAQNLETSQQEEARNRWLAQQQASFQQPKPSSIIDSTLAPSPSSSPLQPLSPPATQPTTPEEEDDYNWNEGEGSIQT